MAMKILSQTASASACERNWSTFALIHTKRRNRLAYKTLEKLVFCSFNQKLSLRNEQEAWNREHVDPYEFLERSMEMAAAGNDFDDAIVEWIQPIQLDDAAGRPAPDVAAEAARFGYDVNAILREEVHRPNPHFGSDTITTPPESSQIRTPPDTPPAGEGGSDRGSDGGGDGGGGGGDLTGWDAYAAGSPSGGQSGGGQWDGGQWGGGQQQERTGWDAYAAGSSTGGQWGGGGYHDPASGGYIPDSRYSHHRDHRGYVEDDAESSMGQHYPTSYASSSMGEYYRHSSCDIDDLSSQFGDRMSLDPSSQHSQPQYISPTPPSHDIMVLCTRDRVAPVWEGDLWAHPLYLCRGAFIGQQDYDNHLIHYLESYMTDGCSWQNYLVSHGNVEVASRNPSYLGFEHWFGQ